jgi:hypothetical protein
MLSTHIFGFEQIHQPKIASIGQGNSVVDFSRDVIICCDL